MKALEQPTAPGAKKLVTSVMHHMTLDCVPEGAESAVWLRDPQSRAISSFWYLKRKWRGTGADARTQMWNETFDVPSTLFAALGNVEDPIHDVAVGLADVLTGLRRGMGGDCSDPAAVNSTQAYYMGHGAQLPDFVGLVDEFHRDWPRFLAFMKWPVDPGLPWKNSSKSERSDDERERLSAEAERYVRWRYACDFALLESFDAETNTLFEDVRVRSAGQGGPVRRPG